MPWAAPRVSKGTAGAGARGDLVLMPPLAWQGTRGGRPSPHQDGSDHGSDYGELSIKTLV